MGKITVIISPIPAFQDNYIWAIHNDRNMIAVDPGDAQPVLSFCQQKNLTLSTVLITHHHADHTGGISALKTAFPQLKVYGPHNSKISGITHSVSDGEQISCSNPAIKFDVIAIPGHTLDHLAYIGNEQVFCGDTLFHSGCGRLFEGTPAQMLNSLKRLAALPPQTQVYCAHEYTQANLDFAQAVDRDNEQLQQVVTKVAQQRQQKLPSLPTSIREQIAVNPFLRSHQPQVQSAVSEWSANACTDELSTFTQLRRWKDQF